MRVHTRTHTGIQRETDTHEHTERQTHTKTGTSEEGAEVSIDVLTFIHVVKSLTSFPDVL
jgi:hypothetical protein